MNTADQPGSRPFRLTCPTCGKTVDFARRDDARFRPFCCGRCKDIDLGKWLSGEYRISDPLPPQFDADALE